MAPCRETNQQKHLTKRAVHEALPFIFTQTSSFMSTRRKQANRYALPIALLMLLVAWAVQQWLTSREPGQDSGRGLPRNTAWLVYSRHAACRMDCRRISKAEVEDILQHGKVNYRKSEIGDQPECRRKYALEGNTQDGQRVRIVFAPCGKKITVVTAIDLDLENENCICP